MDKTNKLNKTNKPNKKIFRWFVLYITSAQQEHNYFLNTIMPYLKALRKEHLNGVEMDLIYIGKKKNASEFIENRIIKIRPEKPYYKEKKIDKNIDVQILMDKLEKPYKGIMLSSHSNGVTIGSDKFPVIEVVEFIEVCKKYISSRGTKVNFFVCDCCYMGSIETLYQASYVAKYILATPSYHDGNFSFIQCPDVYNRHNDNVVWLSKFSNWYIDISDTYCKKLDYQIQWAIYSSNEIIELAEYLIDTQLTHELAFYKSSVIYWDDDNLHNFSIVIENTLKKKPQLKRKLNKLMLLYLKSFVYYMNNRNCNCKVKACPMSIHKDLPTYLSKEMSCRLEFFKKVHCKNVVENLVENPEAIQEVKDNEESKQQ